MDKDIKLHNLSVHCRTCLNKLTERKYNLMEIPNSMLELLKHCQNGTNFERIECLPHSICAQCYERLESFDDFQTMSRKSEQYLENLLKHEQINSKNSEGGAQENAQLQDYEEQTNFDETDDFETVLIKIELKEAGTNLSLENETQDTDFKHLIDTTLQNENLDFNFKNNEKICDSINESKTHKRTSQNPKTFECDKCDYRFFKKSQLKNHIIDVHKIENLEIVCKYGCEKKFRRPHNAELHYCTKHKESENILNLNQEEKQKVDEIDNSNINVKLEETFPTITKTTCTVCFQNFVNITGLRSHMAIHAATRPFQCDQCDRGFNLKSRLKRHIKEIHTDTPLQLQCKYQCGKIFSRHESLMNHYRIKHILPEKGIKPKLKLYICEDCGHAFKTLYNLKEHSYTHRPKEERPYQCEQCKKRFVGKRHYEIHLLRHAGIKNFECEICGLKTTTKKELGNHMNSHTKEKQVTCPLCSKVYTNPENLRRHTLIVHQGVKKYKCRFCDNVFGKADHLKHHEMRHTGEKPHKCEMCDRAFIQLVALKAHIKTHNKMPKFPE